MLKRLQIIKGGTHTRPSLSVTASAAAAEEGVRDLSFPCVCIRSTGAFPDHLQSVVIPNIKCSEPPAEYTVAFAHFSHAADEGLKSTRDPI